MNFNELSQYTYTDRQKAKMIDSLLGVTLEMRSLTVLERAYMSESPYLKYCPKCGRKFRDDELFCYHCLVKLKEFKNVNVMDLDITPEFKTGKDNIFNSFEDIFTPENLERVSEFKFTTKDLKKIIKNIKKTVLKRLDETVKENEISTDIISVKDRILLFSKAFVNVEYKSYGAELGYFEFDRIYIDDRQLGALQITTLIHELSHFLLKEIIAHIICELLDCEKTPEIESIAVFILSYTPVNQLIDEYCAHTVEGRFTLFGYQDYSSFINIQNQIDLPAEEIEMIKTIANTFSHFIKDILESFIDMEMLEDIKTQFRSEILDSPDYSNLAYENCTLLKDDGMIRAIQFIIAEGFQISMENRKTLSQYSMHWK